MIIRSGTVTIIAPKKNNKLLLSKARIQCNGWQTNESHNYFDLGVIFFFFFPLSRFNWFDVALQTVRKKTNKMGGFAVNMCDFLTWIFSMSSIFRRNFNYAKPNAYFRVLYTHSQFNNGIMLKTLTHAILSESNHSIRHSIIRLDASFFISIALFFFSCCCCSSTNICSSTTKIYYRLDFLLFCKNKNTQAHKLTLTHTHTVHPLWLWKIHCLSIRNLFH